MLITITTIPHKEQRYDTTDDWIVLPDGCISMTVSENDDPIEVMREILHGLTECLLCMKHGITQQQVDDFDLAHPETDDPGALPDAPYRLEHAAGNIAESLIDL